ncbi:unnamed protein product [Peronospora destructor]|uniref:J domain-containing protein n=1 Tax=Peronospora destructor TaxID=86335 RepID=A0AAV0V8T9_9STRA|nr:unnamed protein product [Peronospora destructor]
MLSGKLLRRGLQQTLRAPWQTRSFLAATEKTKYDISSAPCRQEDDGPNCWKCHHITDCCSFFCKTCNAIQPISKSCHCDYFEMFKLPKNFNLEPRTIEKTYWNLQKRLHPDLYGAKSEFEKKLSAVNAAVINDAYKMLKTPNTRVKYLLTLHGIDALGETASTAVDPKLLMQTMEFRERIAEAPGVGVLHKMRKEVSDDIDAVINKLGEAYDRDQDLESTKQYAVQLQYMVKCVEEIDLKEEKLDEY